MSPAEHARERIRAVIAGSRVPEDPRHADNTLAWLRRLEPEADETLQIAALAHDIDRAIEADKVQRADFKDYDDFKAAHAAHGAAILREILNACRVEQAITDEACRLVTYHEAGGDPRSDLLKDADSLSYFDVNLPLYFRRHDRQETLRRCAWGYRRLSARAQPIVLTFDYDDPDLRLLVKETTHVSGRP